MSKRNGLAFLDLDKLSVQEMTPKSLQIFVKHREKQKDSTGRKVEFDSPCQIYAVLSLYGNRTSQTIEITSRASHTNPTNYRKLHNSKSPNSLRGSILHIPLMLFICCLNVCFQMLHDGSLLNMDHLHRANTPAFPFSQQTWGWVGWVAHVSTTRHSITYLGSTPEKKTVRKESYCK